MSELSVSIRNYIDNVIRLDSKDIQQCAKSREWFLERIKTEINARNNQPILFAEDPFIKFGSYFKGTKVADVDEYDILVVIDSCNGQYTNDGRVIGRGLGSASPNYKYQELLYQLNSNAVSSQKMLWWLKEIVQNIIDSFDGEPVNEDGIAVTAEIKSKGFKIDLVPCGVFKAIANGKTFYNIGDGNDSWTLTSPQDDIERINNIADNKEDFKNIIRICKRIKDQYDLKVKSFAIETAIANYAESTTKASWDMCNIVGRMIGCLEALANSIQTGQILDNWNKNLLESAIDYQVDAKSYTTIAAWLRSREILIQCGTQDALNDFVESLFDNKS
jgi:hypothetical protein